MLCGVLALTSCFDKDYDLDDIDMTLKLGSSDEVLWTPKNDIDSLMLINVMKLDDDDIVKVVWDKREQDSIFCISSDGDDNMYAVWYYGDETMTITNLRSDPMKMDNRPDCLNGDSVCLDMVNPMLGVECLNDCSADIDVVMEYRSWCDGVVCSTVVTPSVHVPANSRTFKYFSKEQEEDRYMPDRYKGYEWVRMDINSLLCIKINRNGRMVPVAPDSITSVAKRVTLTNTEGEMEVMGKITLRYSVYAPFRFDKDFCIFYQEEGDDWYSDLTDLEDVGIQEILCKANVVNDFPLNLRLHLTAIDVEGNPIPNLVVTSPHAKASGTSPIQFSIRSKDGRPLNAYLGKDSKEQKLDGVKMRLRLSSDGLPSRDPVHSDANLRLVDLRVGVRGGITLDLND